MAPSDHSPQSDVRAAPSTKSTPALVANSRQSRLGAESRPEDWPSVSVILPVLNEERYIRACLHAIMAQDFPGSKLEILVVDGMSSDRTVELVTGCAAEDPRIRLLFNVQRRIPVALNIGVAAARGDVIVRVDGHSVIRADHVRRCVGFLLESGADHVGGLMQARGPGYVASGIALALSSPFGVGTARFRYTRREQDLDTVPFGAFRRETVLRLGGFDQDFHVGEDSEFDYRIILSGGRVRIDPTISTDYYCRDTLLRLAQQFFRYGHAKALLLHKHSRLPSPRALAPACLLSTIGTLALGSAFCSAMRRYLFAVVAGYTLLCTAVGWITAVRRGLRYGPLLPVVFAVLHISHGAGFLAGLRRFPFERPHGSRPGTSTPIRPSAGLLHE